MTRWTQLIEEPDGRLSSSRLLAIATTIAMFFLILLDSYLRTFHGQTEGVSLGLASLLMSGYAPYVGNQIGAGIAGRSSYATSYNNGYRAATPMAGSVNNPDLAAGYVGGMDNSGLEGR